MILTQGHMAGKFNTILRLSKIHASPLRTIDPERVTYAMIMCLTNDELIDFYFDYFSSELENQIVSRIRKRLEEGSMEGFEGPLPGIIELMEDEDYNGSYRKLRSHVRRFLPYLEADDKRTVFNYFIDSHRKSDRMVACEAAGDIWSIEVESLLWEAWHKWTGEHVVEILAEHGNPIRLSEIVEEVWAKGNIKTRVKRKVARAVAQRDLQAVAFIEDINPLTYFHLVLLAGNDVSDDDSVRYVTGAVDSDEFGFGIYLLGKAGKWELLNLFQHSFSLI